jgi:hypothetical protein
MSRDPAVVGLRRRFGALLYDAIAAIAVLYFAAFAPVVASGGALAPGNLPFMLYLLLVLFGYFGLGWTTVPRRGTVARARRRRLPGGAGRPGPAHLARPLVAHTPGTPGQVHCAR